MSTLGEGLWSRKRRRARAAISPLPIRATPPLSLQYPLTSLISLLHTPKHYPQHHKRHPPLLAITSCRRHPRASRDGSTSAASSLHRQSILANRVGEGRKLAGFRTNITEITVLFSRNYTRLHSLTPSRSFGHSYPLRQPRRSSLLLVWWNRDIPLERVAVTHFETARRPLH